MDTNKDVEMIYNNESIEKNQESIVEKSFSSENLNNDESIEKIEESVVENQSYYDINEVESCSLSEDSEEEIMNLMEKLNDDTRRKDKPWTEEEIRKEHPKCCIITPETNKSLYDKSKSKFPSQLMKYVLKRKREIYSSGNEKKTLGKILNVENFGDILVVYNENNENCDHKKGTQCFKIISKIRNAWRYRNDDDGLKTTFYSMPISMKKIQKNEND